jgi:hypothetical protein
MLHPDDREEVVQNGLTLLEAEILCVMKLEDIARGAATVGEQPFAEEIGPRRRQRQLKFKF